MNALSASLVLCLVAAAYGFPEPQVVGGKDAAVGMFPYQVSLRENGDHFCGGSIINKRYILTAAHCIADMNSEIKNLTVHAGTTKLDSKGVVYGIEKMVAHRHFGTIALINDIGLIRVDKDIDFNNYIKPIPLATGSNSYEGSKCILTGWGYTNNGHGLPNNLQYVNLLVESQLKCKNHFDTLHSSQICTFTKAGEGACNGDSGGPLVSNGVQIGIVSFGEPCAVGSPDVYTRVSSFESWIENQQSYLNSQDAQEPFDDVYIH